MPPKLYNDGVIIDFSLENISKLGIRIDSLVKLGDNTVLGKLVSISKGSVIGDGCNIKEVVIIGKNVHIGSNVIIGKCSVIEDGVIVGDNVVIHDFVFIAKNSVIGNNVFIGKESRIKGGNVKNKTVIPEKSIIAPSLFSPSNLSLKRGIKKEKRKDNSKKGENYG